MVNHYVPKDGDVIIINFDPQKGHEQSGRRPALVLSPEEYNRKTGLAVVCPVTNQKKGYPFEVEIPDGLSVKGVIISDQIKNLDWRSKKAKFICRLDYSIVDEVVSKILPLIDF